MKQEPYAWEFCGALFHDKDDVFGWWEEMKRTDEQITENPPLPLYTAPIELSDEQKDEIIVEYMGEQHKGDYVLRHMIGAILKKASEK